MCMYASNMNHLRFYMLSVTWLLFYVRFNANCSYHLICWIVFFLLLSDISFPKMSKWLAFLNWGNVHFINRTPPRKYTIFSSSSSNQIKWYTSGMVGKEKEKKVCRTYISMFVFSRRPHVSNENKTTFFVLFCDTSSDQT